MSPYSLQHKLLSCHLHTIPFCRDPGFKIPLFLAWVIVLADCLLELVKTILYGFLLWMSEITEGFLKNVKKLLIFLILVGGVQNCGTRNYGWSLVVGDFFLTYILVVPSFYLEVYMIIS